MSFVWSLKREWMEHASTFYWAMGIMVLMMLSSALIVTLIDANYEFTSTEFSELSDNSDEGQFEHFMDEEGNVFVRGLGAIATLALDPAGSTDEELREKMSAPLDVVELIFHWVLLIVSVFTLVAVMYDERKDQSILFWKSMPVSDVQSVASKFVFGAWIAPRITIVGIFLGQLVVVGLASSAVEDGMGGRIWSASELWGRPFANLLGYLVHGLWILPVYAWVMLVSSFAKSAPFLWAIGIPWVVFWFEGIFFGSSRIATWVYSHIEAQALPHIAKSESGAGALSTLLSGHLFIGVLVGLGLLALTVYCRRRYTEL